MEKSRQPRAFKMGERVVLIKGSRVMSVLKYDDKLSLAAGKNIVTVTWRESGNHHIARYHEEDLKFFID